MVFTFSVPAVLSMSAGFFLVFMMPYVWKYRKENPSAAAYTALLGSVSLWAFSYGVALTVFDPTLRRLFEIPIWTARILTVFMIFVTGFRYSGHDRNLPTWLKAAIVSVFISSWLLQVTNVLGFHTLMWDSYTVEPVMGAAAAQFDPTIYTYLLICAAYASVALAYLLALEAVLSYGPLYRVHAVAIVMWSLPPLVANVVWLVNLSDQTWVDLPLAGLDLTPPSLLLTSAVLAYILFVREEDLLEIVPANRRIAEKVAEDNIDTGIVMVNKDGLILGMNQPAAEVFGMEKEEALAEPLHEVAGVSIGLPVEEPTTVDFPDDPSRTYQVSTSEISDGRGSDELGYTVNIQDITKQRQRQQRLEVLNRVLRHNLRNDMVVINGNADQVAEIVEGAGDGISDELAKRVREKTDLIDRTADELVSISEKARDISEALPDGVPRRRSVNLGELVQSVVDGITNDHPEASVTVSAPDNHRIFTDERLLRVVLENLVENAVVHNDTDEPSVSVTVSAIEEADDAEEEFDDGATRITVEDDGPGVPDHEIDVIDRGYEDSIEHGSGLGLWIASWGVQDLRGKLEFDTDEGTTVTVTLSNLAPGTDEG